MHDVADRDFQRPDHRRLERLDHNARRAGDEFALGRHHLVHVRHGRPRDCRCDQQYDQIQSRSCQPRRPPFLELHRIGLEFRRQFCVPPLDDSKVTPACRCEAAAAGDLGLALGSAHALCFICWCHRVR